jgi:15-cis-phytoene synthase
VGIVGQRPTHNADQMRASWQYCRDLTLQTAHNFRYAFLTLPRRQYDAMCALYAFMRITDDLGDNEQLSLSERRAQLQQWEEQFRAALGQCGLADHQATLADRASSSGGDCDTIDHPALPAVAETVREYAIPPQYLLDVVRGVERDLHPQPIVTMADLQEYCYHVAGAVGLCCLHIWGHQGPSAHSLAIDCGFAFQLTNMLRDVAEDAAMGRIYLPQEDLQRFGVSAEQILARRDDASFRALIQFEAMRAHAAFEASANLERLVSPVGRPILRAMREIYFGLLQRIVAANYDVLSTRVALPRWQKLWIAGKAWTVGACSPSRWIAAREASQTD